MLLFDIHLTQHSPTPLYGDNEPAERMVNHSNHAGRSRHVDIQFYVLQEWAKRGLAIVRRVPTKWNVTDALTKILGWVLHSRHCDEMMGYNGPKYWR